jgi:hypothetical protein
LNVSSNKTYFNVKKAYSLKYLEGKTSFSIVHAYSFSSSNEHPKPKGGAYEEELLYQSPSTLHISS